MEATVFEIKRFAVHDGAGVRTTVFFKGCPLRCRWCHNPEGFERRTELGWFAHLCTGCGVCAEQCPSGVHTVENGVHRLNKENCTRCGRCISRCPGRAMKLYGRTVTVDGLLPELLQDREFYEVSGGGVTLSGGECLMQADFCAELAARLNAEGVAVDIDTCGFVPQSALEQVLPYTDTFLYDLKAIDPEVHRACTGQPNGLILSNLRYLDAAGARVEIRIPYVPEWNSAELPKMRELLTGMKSVKRVTVLPYHDLAGSKYRALDRTNTLPAALPSEEELSRAQALFDFINCRE